MPTAIASRQDWPKAMSAICRASSSGDRLKLSHCCGLCEERSSIWLSAMIGIARFGSRESEVTPVLVSGPITMSAPLSMAP